MKDVVGRNVMRLMVDTTHLPGNRWEIPSSEAIGQISIEPPKCVNDFADQGMISTTYARLDG